MEEIGSDPNEISLQSYTYAVSVAYAVIDLLCNIYRYIITFIMLLITSPNGETKSSITIKVRAKVTEIYVNVRHSSALLYILIYYIRYYSD